MPACAGMTKIIFACGRGISTTLEMELRKVAKKQWKPRYLAP
jgi:galactitol-specific phosphotransferase system IIB component